MTRILMTGATSCTGSWIARALAEGGHETHLALRQPTTELDEVQRLRLDPLLGRVTVHTGISHDSASLQALIAKVTPDVFVMHAHPMEGFRGADYDHVGAVAAMTARLPLQLDELAATGARVVYSGTVYEPDAARPGVSSYGVSKLTVWEHVRLGAMHRGIPAVRVAIPNPYGPLENGRLGNYLAAEWAHGRTPVIRTPKYVRDNIPVQELAARYVELIDTDVEAPHTVTPSGYLGTQAEFAERVAQEIGERLGRDLAVEFTMDAPHPEPLVVVNDGSHSSTFETRESSYWDAYAAMFEEAFRREG